MAKKSSKKLKIGKDTLIHQTNDAAIELHVGSIRFTLILFMSIIVVVFWRSFQKGNDHVDLNMSQINSPGLLKGSEIPFLRQSSGKGLAYKFLKS